MRNCLNFPSQPSNKVCESNSETTYVADHNHLWSNIA